MRFLSYDGILAQIVRYIGRLILLNICYILCCLPVFTFGATTTALYTVFLNDREDERLVRRYFKAFKDNFKQATKIWLVFLLLLMVLIGDYYCLFAFDFSGENVAWIVTIIISVVYLSITSFVFPLQAHYENRPRTTIRNAVVLGVGLILLGIALNCVTFLPAIVYLVSEDLYVNVMIWWIPVWFALAAQINALILGWIFRKIQPEEKQEE